LRRSDNGSTGSGAWCSRSTNAAPSISVATIAGEVHGYTLPPSPDEHEQQARHGSSHRARAEVIDRMLPPLDRQVHAH
jgi:hypothetical protein